MNPSDPNTTPPKDNFGAKPEESAELQDVENSLEANTSPASPESQNPTPIQDIKPPTPAPTSGSQPVVIPPDDSAADPSLSSEAPQPAPTVEPMTSPSPAPEPSTQAPQNDEPLPPPAAPTGAVGSFGSNTAAPSMPKQKKSKKELIVILSILLIAALAVGGYLYWQSTQNPAQPASTETPAVEAEADTTPVDTTDGLDAEIETIESEIDQIDDSEFQDQTLSDDTLEQQ